MPSISEIAVNIWKLIKFFHHYLVDYLLKGIGDLNSDSAGTPLDSSVTTETPYGLSSSRNAQAVPSTEFLEAL